MTLIRNHKRLIILIGCLICICALLSVYFRPINVSNLIGADNIDHIRFIRITRVNTLSDKTISKNTISDYNKCKNLIRQLSAFPLRKQIRWDKIFATGEPSYIDISERIKLSIVSEKSSKQWKQWDFYIYYRPHGIKIFEMDSDHRNNEYSYRIGNVWGSGEEKFYRFLTKCIQEDPLV